MTNEQNEPAVLGPVQRQVRPHRARQIRTLANWCVAAYLGKMTLQERDAQVGELFDGRIEEEHERCASEIVRLRAALERIGAMDPATDSIEGYNEWGEADCFRQAQSTALRALGPNG